MVAVKKEPRRDSLGDEYILGHRCLRGADGVRIRGDLSGARGMDDKAARRTGAPNWEHHIRACRNGRSDDAVACTILLDARTHSAGRPPGAGSVLRCDAGLFILDSERRGKLSQACTPASRF